MANSKHTPGPWRLGTNGVVVSDSSEGITITGATGKENTDYYGGNLICESVSLGNAKLIASAPELLEVVTELHKLLNKHLPSWYSKYHYNITEKAIKKVTE